MTYTIRPKTYRKYSRKTGDYTKVVSAFERYEVGEIKKSDKGWETIQIVGPKQTFYLCQTAKPLTVIRPPINDGENAIKKQLPFYFVMGSGMNCSKIQGASHFALDGNELIAYRSSGRGLVEEL